MKITYVPSIISVKRELMPHQVAQSFLGQPNIPYTQEAIDSFRRSLLQEYKMRGLHQSSIEMLSEENRAWYLSYRKALSILSTF